MLANGFATGHGDTVEDLLRELTWQVSELRKRRDMRNCTICGEPLPEGVPVARAPETVADLMRRWRAVAGLSRAEAAEQLGLSPNAIRDIEQGLRRDGDRLTALGLKKLIEDAK